MHKLIALLLTLSLVAVPFAGCGEEEPPQTAAEFCAEHGGVVPDSEEPDGDAMCEDGTEFEAEGEEESSSDKKKKKKKSKSKSRSSSKRR